MSDTTPIARALGNAVADADDLFRIAATDASGTVPTGPHAHALVRALLVATIDAVAALELEIATLRRDRSV